MTALPAPLRATTPPIPPEPSLRGVVLAGVVAVGVGFGGFFGWAMTTDLDSAAIAPGTVMVDSRRKTVSHLEGGLLADLLVREGDPVKAGQVLLRLESTQSDALVAQFHAQYWTFLARAARLRAERAGAGSIAFPAELTAAAGNTVAAEAMEAERRLLASRRDAMDGEIAVRRARIEQLRQEITAVDAQRAATLDRLRLTEDELTSVRGLFERGFERKPRLLELQRAVAELQGKMGELHGRAAQATQGIATAELEITTLRNTRDSEVLDELQRAQSQAADLAERLRGALDVQRRQEITAPQAGRVTNLRFVTPGGVIPPGAPILDVVPAQDELIVSARLRPDDIDSVHPGLTALVRLTAYRQRLIHPVEGTVETVSADQLEDPRTGLPYFEARIRLDQKALAQLPDVELHPGMPAEVLIRARPRLAIDYFIAPLTDSMARAFREE